MIHLRPGLSTIDPAPIVERYLLATGLGVADMPHREGGYDVLHENDERRLLDCACEWDRTRKVEIKSY